MRRVIRPWMATTRLRRLWANGASSLPPSAVPSTSSSAVHLSNSSSPAATAVRFFASKRGRRKFQQTKKVTTKKKKKKHNILKPPPGLTILTPEPATNLQEFAPPPFLRATASPHAYVAACAAEDNNIDASTLFSEQDPPESFSNATFSFVSPKEFNFELPTHRIPEVAFLGRSNVGKSSLLNAVTKSSGLARTSKTPGRTQQVNYFALYPNTTGTTSFTTTSNCAHNNNIKASHASGFIVDLPGYGYAKAPDANVSDWQRNTQNFLLQRRDAGAMCRLFLLVDARRGPLQMDRNIMGWLDEAEMQYTVVLTKADRVGRPQQVKSVNELCMRYESLFYQEEEGSFGQGPVVLVTSARDGHGIRELQTAIDAEFVGYFMQQQEEGENQEMGERDEEEEEREERM